MVREEEPREKAKRVEFSSWVKGNLRRGRAGILSVWGLGKTPHTEGGLQTEQQGWRRVGEQREV